MRCVYRSFDHTEAEIVAALLRAQGCDAHVFENGLSRLIWPQVTAYGGTRVTVADANRNTALDIVARWNKGGYALAEGDADHDPLRCPRCRSDEVESDDRYRGWSFVIAYITSLPLFWPKWRERCRSCDFRWKAAPRRTYREMMPTASAQDSDG